MAQRTQKKDIRSIEINISWTYATKIYIEVLRNPEANPESIATARSELLRLAKFVDTGFRDDHGEVRDWLPPHKEPKA
jgi:hypothetical protein